MSKNTQVQQAGWISLIFGALLGFVILVLAVFFPSTFSKDMFHLIQTEWIFLVLALIVAAGFLGLFWFAGRNAAGQLLKQQSLPWVSFKFALTINVIIWGLIFYSPFIGGIAALFAFMFYFIFIPILIAGFVITYFIAFIICSVIKNNNFTKEELLLIKALVSFHFKVNELINLLANQYNLDLTGKDPFNQLLSSKNNLWKGHLPDNWTYQFHGGSCRFENTETGQFLDTRINCGANYGTIDEYFLEKYIETSQDLKYIIKMIQTKEKLHNTLLSLEKKSIIVQIGEEPFSFKMLDFKAIPNEAKPFS